MKRQNYIKKYSVHMLALATLMVSAEISFAPDNIVRINEQARVVHAKELLGKRYMASAVSKTKENVSLHNYVYQKAQQALKGNWKKKSWIVSEAIISNANKYELDPLFVMAMIQQESSWNTKAIGGVGELGLMQIRPTTAQWVCNKMGFVWLGAESLKNPVVNIQIGTAYIWLLRKQMDFHGQMYLSAYNMGKKKVFQTIKAKNAMPKEYASKVMKHYVEFYNELNESLTYAERIEEMSRHYRMAAYTETI